MTDRFAIDKTLIHRLVSFKALWGYTETVGIHWSPLYGEKSWNVYIKKTNLFPTDERKTWTSWMTWGWVNHQQKFSAKVN